MTTKTLARAIKNKKPAIIKEKGTPQYVVLDWDTYQWWQKFLVQVEDFRKTRLYTEAFLQDLEAGLRKSSYIKRHGNKKT